MNQNFYVHYYVIGWHSNSVRKYLFEQNISVESE